MDLKHRIESETFRGLELFPETKFYCIGIAADHLSAVKFGVSNCPGARLLSLQTGSPVQLELIGVVDGSRHLERMVHRYLVADRIHGEWFRRSTRTKELVELVRAGSLLAIEDLVRARRVLRR